MANTDKNILITPAVGSSTDDPKIVFQGANASVGPQSITLRVYPDNSGTISFEGSAGQLFSITNDLTGSLFSVNDISGIPSIDVNADGTVSLAKFGGNISIGNVTPTAKLHVVGDMIVDNIDLDGNTISTIDTNGNLVLAPNGTGQVTTNTTINATRFVSNVATGTAPFTVTSTTLVANLNVANATYATSAGTATSATSATSATTAGTVTTAAQPNITSVGTLSALTVTGNVTVGNIIRSGGTSAQFLKADGSIDSSAYITSSSVGNGTLTLNTSGNGLSGSTTFTANQSGAGTFTVTSNATNANTANTIVYRDASGNFSAGTITATLSGSATSAGSATTAGTVTTAAQPNITSVGTLTSLGVSGAVTASTFTSNVATGTAPFTVTSTTQVANLNVANAGYATSAGTATSATSATTAGTVTTAAQPNITSVGTLSALTVTGNVTVGNIIRSGGTSAQFLKADGSIDSSAYITSSSVGNGTLTLGVSGTGLSGSATFTANQSGNSTFTVTSNATSANTASAIVARDGSGNFSAGTITAAEFFSSTSTAGSLTDGAAVFNGGSGAIVIDDSGQKRISWNDGAGNFTIRSGNYYNGTNTVNPVAGDGAATIVMSSDATAGAIGFYVSPVNATANSTINYTKSMLLSTTDLSVAADVSVNGNVTASRLISNIATGTAPLTITSTTLVSNLNADLLDGLHVATGTNNVANQIVRTDANGYIQAGWINTISGDNGTTAITRVYASSDGYIRYYTPANFRTVLDVPQKATTLSGYGITNGLVRGGAIGNIDYNAQRTLASGIYSVDAAPTNGPPAGAYSNFIQMYERGDTSAQVVVDYATGRMYSRGIQTATPTYSPWRTQIDDGNYNSYSPTLTGTGASGTWAISITGTANSAKYADLAERYVADRKYSPGTVLMIGGEAEVTIATKGSRTVVGTVSEHGFQMNVDLEGENVLPVAYIGRVPCKIEGEVNRGDFLVVGDTPGVAVAADYSKDLTGMLIGKALEESDGTKEIIEILVGRL